MKRNQAILAIVIAAILVAAVVSSSRQTKPSASSSRTVTIFFSQAETQIVHSTIGPGLLPGPRLQATFSVTNTAGRSVVLQVAAIERNDGSGWMADTQAIAANTFLNFGDVEARATARISFVIPSAIPAEPMPSRLRVLVSPNATTVQQSGIALRRLRDNWSGRAKHKELWLDNLFIPTYEIVTPEIP